MDGLVNDRMPAAPRLRTASVPQGKLRPPGKRHLTRHALAARRVLVMLVFTPVAVLIQCGLLLLPGRAKASFARFYWASIARMLGLSVRAIGQKAEGRGRRVIYVCNHSSWLDIPAAGALLTACFVSKDDVEHWPVIGLIARLGRTIFVSRSRTGMEREREQMRGHLAAGNDLILFPEGTSSDGSRVLPFRSAFFAIAHGEDAAETRPLVQPVSIVYDRLAGLPVGRASRTVFAWFGDMSLAPHLWKIAQVRGKRVTLLFHAPLEPEAFATRKALSQAAWDAVADGAATLRQNRPARPAPSPVPIAVAEPAFA